MRLAAVSTRIGALVPELSGRTLHAGDFADLVDKNRLPQVTPAAYVLPGGMTGGQAQIMAGVTIQDFSETVMVVLAVRVAGDPLHAAAIDTAGPLVTAVIRAVVGWAPDDEVPGVFILGRAELVGAKDGLLIFQIEFNLMDQLRITA